jgi:hypothetical protein
VSDYFQEDFNIAIDKGTIDSAITGENAIANVKSILNSVHRVLKDDGFD